MNHWPFIAAAYGITFAVTVAVTLWSYVSMRRAEQALSQLERDR
jgi:heme exporter protein CcmD